MAYFRYGLLLVAAVSWAGPPVYIRAAGGTEYVSLSSRSARAHEILVTTYPNGVGRLGISRRLLDEQTLKRWSREGEEWVGIHDAVYDSGRQRVYLLLSLNPARIVEERLYDVLCRTPGPGPNARHALREDQVFRLMPTLLVISLTPEGNIDQGFGELNTPGAMVVEGGLRTPDAARALFREAVSGSGSAELFPLVSDSPFALSPPTTNQALANFMGTVHAQTQRRLSLPSPPPALRSIPSRLGLLALDVADSTLHVLYREKGKYKKDVLLQHAAYSVTTSSRLSLGPPVGLPDWSEVQFALHLPSPSRLLVTSVRDFRQNFSVMPYDQNIGNPAVLELDPLFHMRPLREYHALAGSEGVTTLSTVALEPLLTNQYVVLSPHSAPVRSTPAVTGRSQLFQFVDGAPFMPGVWMRFGDAIFYKGMHGSAHDVSAFDESTATGILDVPTLRNEALRDGISLAPECLHQMLDN